MNDGQFKCPTCGGGFNSSEELNSHAKQAHGSQEGDQEEHAITCSKCGFKSRTPGEMDEHNKGHMGA